MPYSLGIEKDRVEEIKLDLYHEILTKAIEKVSIYFSLFEK